jgi:hypothetical protein
MAALVAYFAWLKRDRARYHQSLHDGSFARRHVYVEKDGSIRELRRSEIDYLSTDFLPGDSGRPYIKPRYETRNAQGDPCGFLARRKAPRDIHIVAAKDLGTDDP